MTLRSRMAIAMIALVAATAGSVAWLANHAFRSQAVSEALDGLDFEARLLVGALQSTAMDAGADVLSLAGMPPVRDVADGGPRRDRSAEDLSRIFASVLHTNRHYLQLRFLDVDGKEVVRVDRSGPEGSVRSVARDSLQDKSDRPYVAGTLSLRPGELYVSRVDLNQEFGVVQEPHVPVLRLATPVATGGGAVGGMVILNVDMRDVFTTLRADVGTGRALYVMSGGRYLVHPDPAREFTGVAGSRAADGDDLPELIRRLPVDNGQGIVTSPSGASIGWTERSVALAGGPPVTVVLTEPRAQLLASEGRVVRSALFGGALLALVAAAVAALLARSLARPVVDVARAVGRFERTGVWEPPLRSSGELSVLTHALGRAIRSEREKQDELEREIIMRSEVEKALAREAAQLRLLSSVANSSLDAIYTMSVDGVVTSWNPGAERLFGYPPEEIVGRSVNVLVPDSLTETVAQILERLREGEPVRDYETTRVARDGLVREVSLTLSPVRSDDGAVIGISAIARDVGERKALEERFRLAVEACPNGMVMVDGDGRMVLVNQEVERLFGYTRDELLGESIEILVPESTRDRHPDLRKSYSRNPHRRAMGSGRDLFGRCKNGTEIPVEIGLNPIRTSDGPFVLASIVDISERMKAQEELRRSNAELEQFAYVASHDLQEPLRMVASYTELLGKRYEGRLDERADEYIYYAVDGARRMRLLINDLLRFSRINSEAKALEPTDLAETVRQVVQERLAASIREAGATVEVGDLPVVLADDVQIGQVFQNLISNGIKFSADGRPPHVRVGAQRRGRFWVVSVEDNGIGIEEEYAERVFEMFQRLHGVGVYPGSGIGLTLARKIVQRHGGSIWFESTVGTGTTFHFTLPAVES